MLSKNALLVDVVGLSLGTFHTMFVKQDGSVWTSGGHSVDPSKSFVQVIPSGATSVAAGTDFSIVLKQDRYVWAKGENSKGQLGDATTTTKDKFYFVRMIDSANVVATGSYHNMILTQRGMVWAAGWNKYGQLGDGSTSDRTRFF